MKAITTFSRPTVSSRLAIRKKATTLLMKVERKYSRAPPGESENGIETTATSVSDEIRRISGVATVSGRRYTRRLRTYATAARPADTCAGRSGSRMVKKFCGAMNRTNVKSMRHQNGAALSRAAGAGEVHETPGRAGV